MQRCSFAGHLGLQDQVSMLVLQCVCVCVCVLTFAYMISVAIRPYRHRAQMPGSFKGILSADAAGYDKIS
jgi:hypothetical protein